MPEQPQETAQNDKTPEQLQDEIRETRNELGETVEALAHKADVKARAGEKVDEAKETAHEKFEQGRAAVPVPVIAGVIAAALVALVLIRRR